MMQPYAERCYAENTSSCRSTQQIHTQVDRRFLIVDHQAHIDLTPAGVRRYGQTCWSFEHIHHHATPFKSANALLFSPRVSVLYAAAVLSEFFDDARRATRYTCALPPPLHVLYLPSALIATNTTIGFLAAIYLIWFRYSICRRTERVFLLVAVLMSSAP